MITTIKTIFDKHAVGLKVDKALIQKIQRYRQKFASKNDDHIQFFGGHLMGVQEVRFTQEDRAIWLSTIYPDMIDEDVSDEIMELKTFVPDPTKIRHVSTDVFNLGCIYLIHRIHTSPHLSDKEKYSAMVDTMLVLEYKFITSILAYWFRYKGDEAVATATYALMDKSWKLKQTGSWGALLSSLAEHLLGQTSPHTRNKAWQNFQDDYSVIYMVNDTQGRIKDYLKNIRDLYEIVRKDPRLSIRTNSNTAVNMDGEIVVKTRTNQYAIYRRYIEETMSDPVSFIRPELMDIVASVMPKLPRESLHEALVYLSKNSSAKGDPDVRVLLDLTLTHFFEFLNANRRTLNTKDLAAVLSRLSNLYKASRANNPLLIDMRDTGERVVRKTMRPKTPTGKDALVASIRTALFLYLVLRTTTMEFYKQTRGSATHLRSRSRAA